MEQGNFDVLEDSGETYLTRRFGRPAPTPEKLAYEFTRDAGFMHQYILLRDEHFSAGNGDAFDVTSEIIVARRGLHCIAGGRLTLSAPSQRQALPMQENGIDPQRVMPKLNLNDHAFGELSRLAILPEFEGGEVLPELLRRIIKKAIAERVEYVFHVASQHETSECCRAAQLFGVKWEMRPDIAVPANDEARQVLSVMDLTHHIPKIPVKSKREKVVAQ